jgi:DNA-binding response OmpR family regulator
MTKELKQARFLIAESEPEILSLFKTYLDSFGVESVTVDNGNQALETFLQGKNEGNEYDAIVLDTHLKGKTGLDLAKAIRERDSPQKIILVTTSMKEQLPKEDLQSAAIDEKDILVMPFALSRLSNLLINAP